MHFLLHILYVLEESYNFTTVPPIDELNTVVYLVLIGLIAPKN